MVSTFQERLGEAMNGMGVTELANTLGISKQSISAYINGTRKPKRLTIDGIARALHVNPAWLMGYDVDRFSMPDEIADIETANARRVKAVQDMFKSYCGAEAYSTIEKFLLLDETDRSRISERIDTMLESDKYSVQDESRNA